MLAIEPARFEQPADGRIERAAGLLCHGHGKLHCLEEHVAHGHGFANPRAELSQLTRLVEPAAAALDTIEPVPTDDRVEASLATETWAVMNGVRMIRVHDVSPAAQLARLVTAA